MTTSRGLFVLSAILLSLAFFVAFTTGRMEAILYGILGAGICVGLAFFFRSHKLAPVFVKREPGDKP